MSKTKRFRKSLRKTVTKMMGGSRTPPSSHRSRSRERDSVDHTEKIRLSSYTQDDHDRAIRDLLEKVEEEYQKMRDLVSRSKGDADLVGNARKSRDKIKKAADSTIVRGTTGEAAANAVIQAKLAIQKAKLNEDERAQKALEYYALAAAVNANRLCGLAVDGSLKKDQGRIMAGSTRLWKREKLIRQIGSFDYGTQGENQWEYNGRLKIPDWARNGKDKPDA
jgi:hypothetical protein